VYYNNAIFHHLFLNKFPKEFAIPNRLKVNSKKDVFKLLEQHEGIRDCYISLYPLPYSYTYKIDNTILWEYNSIMIDKISYDLDENEAFEVASEFNFVHKNKYTIIPDITGKKGYHLHIRLKPIYYPIWEAKRLLFNAHIYLISQVFDEIPKEFDSSLFGDIMQIIRIPNTRRPTNKLMWCTFIPPDFDELTEEEVLKFTKHPQNPDNFDYKVNSLPTLYDFPIVKNVHFEELDIIHTLDKSKTYDRNVVYDILQSLLRPCIYRHITADNPIHHARVAATRDLLRRFTPEKIWNWFKVLNWDDWGDGEDAWMYIQYVRNLEHPYSCKKLRYYRIPRICCVE
jgi:hypothetical protein